MTHSHIDPPPPPGRLRLPGVIQALSQAGVTPASGVRDVLACHQQHKVGDHTLDFAWPILKIALEADGGRHLRPSAARRDRLRDARRPAQGWLIFRVDIERDGHLVTAQVGRVVSVVRALAGTTCGNASQTGVV